MQIISLIANLLMGGGLIVTLVTLKSQRAKAAEEARSLSIENDEKVNRLVNEYFVEPLKKEITSLRREMAKLRKAIERIPDCPHASECPVKDELDKTKTDE